MWRGMEIAVVDDDAMRYDNTTTNPTQAPLPPNTINHPSHQITTSALTINSPPFTPQSHHLTISIAIEIHG